MSAGCATPRRPKTEPVPTVLPFQASRRLTGANLFFASAGAQLETVGVEPDAMLLEEWRVRVLRARAWLGWGLPALVARPHAGGASLALAAPIDQLFTATELNEWALCAALVAGADLFHRLRARQAQFLRHVRDPRLQRGDDADVNGRLARQEEPRGAADDDRVAAGRDRQHQPHDPQRLALRGQSAIALEAREL